MNIKRKELDNRILINVGTLNSLGKLYYNIAPSLSYVRDAIKRKENPEVIWDFRYIEQKKMSMSALTAFLSIAKSISDYYERPTQIILQWDPYTLRFLSDISFFRISRELGILTWPDGMLGGFLDSDKVKTSTKIIYFNNVANISYKNEREIYKWKEENRENIKKSFLVNFNEIFFETAFRREWNDYLKFSLSEITSELAVNSLLHGKETAFIGVQRSSRGISICVCDSGIGFLESIKNTNKWIIDLGVDKNIEALFYSSIMKEYDIGLKSVIEDILLSKGWVIMSSNDCEIRWERNNWEKAKSCSENTNFMKQRINIKDVFGEPLKGLISPAELRKGHYKLYKNILKGVRITFEIPFEN